MKLPAPSFVLRSALSILFGFFLLIAGGCGGGSDSNNESTATTAPIALSYSSPQTYTVGTAVTPLNPTVSGTVSTYSVVPTLPAGLTINAATGQISGTPTTAVALTSYIITAANSAGSTTFNLTLAVLIPAPSGLSYQSPKTYVVGAAISPLSPEVTGTVTSYSVAPSLPAGLSIDSSTGQITGTPSIPTASSCVITALNSSGSTTFTLSIAVVPPAPSVFSYSSPQTYTVGAPIAPLDPSVTGVVTSYSVSPALPAGLAMNTVTGQLTGTPTAAVPAAYYLVTVQNGGGAVTFALQIAVLIPPPSALVYSSPHTYTVGVAIAPLNPSVVGAVSNYAIQPALPAGLSINAVTGQISGTPTAAVAMSAYQVAASNSSGLAQANVLLAVLIPPPSGLSYTTPQVFTSGTAIAPLSPTVNGVVTSYSVSPSLPSGLSINSLTGQISGTPTVSSAAANYVITAANSSGSVTFNLSIRVRIAAPSALTYRSPQTFQVGTAISPLNPSVTGAVTSYSVAPALPAGLSINTTTGQISGKPSAAVSATNYVVTAMNSTGSTTFSLSITVVLLPPSALSYANPQVLAVGVALAPLSPFVVSVVSHYSVSPSLPTGLSINASTGQISGTPTVQSAASNYVITATNAAGSTTFNLSIVVAVVGVSPAHVSRIVARGTPVVVALVATSASFPVTGGLFAKAIDASSVFLPSVVVTSSNNGYVLSLTASTTIAAGIYSGNVVINLCSDAACTVPFSTTSITIPYDVNVMASTSAWPGNNLLPLSAWSDAPDWSMYQGNAAHTGFVPVTIDPNNFSPRWQGPTLNASYSYGAAAKTLTTYADKLYLAYGTTLYALKELDGSQSWQYSFSGLTDPSVNPPSVADNTVYIAAGQQSSTFMYAFNAVDGSLVFKSAMSSQWENYLAPTIGPQGIYTNAGTYGGLYGFNPSGQQLFFDGLAQTSLWTPAIDANSVYAYTGDKLTLIDPATGIVQSSITDPSFTNYVYQINGSAVLGASGSVFAANYENAFLNGGGIGNTLLNFNTNTGTIAWQIPGVYPSTPAYDAGVLYVANNNPMRLEARAESNGALLWSWIPPQAGDTSFASEVLLTKTIVLVSTNQAVYGIDLSTRKTVWSYPMPGQLALSRNGILYIQGSGALTAINVK